MCMQELTSLMSIGHCNFDFFSPKCSKMSHDVVFKLEGHLGYYLHSTVKLGH